MDCRYTKTTLMEEPWCNVYNWYPYAWNPLTSITLVNIKSSSSLRHTSRANNENVPWVFYCKKKEAEKNLEKPKPLTKPYTSIWCQDAFGRCVFCGTRCLLSHCLFLLCAQQATALAFHNTTTFERTQYRISIKKNFKKCDKYKHWRNYCSTFWWNCYMINICRI